MHYITVDTKMIGLLGTPLRQSVSYKLQNRVYEQAGLDYFYLPIEVSTEDRLPAVVEGIRAMNFAGFAITKPYKETILKYLDERDDLVTKMGACNTVAVRDGKLIGYNTDGIGCVRSLEVDGGLDIKGKTFFSFGAGGAARAVCFELACRGAKQIVISSASQRCEHLAEDINRLFPGLCVPVRLTDEERMYEYIRQADVLLNMSGIGMAPHLGESPMKKDRFQPHQLCYDAVYDPEKTRFLQDAEAARCRILNGLGMVIYQGLEQIKIWTGVDAPAQIMFDAVRESR
ncbi:shikimate dehydrogenase [Oscillibacter valericigenes Sjm18-20]|nr:shikimate dehydrogenase [Oscillibacter valericigenes Sjm18-20]